MHFYFPFMDFIFLVKFGFYRRTRSIFAYPFPFMAIAVLLDTETFFGFEGIYHKKTLRSLNFLQGTYSQILGE